MFKYALSLLAILSSGSFASTVTLKCHVDESVAHVPAHISKYQVIKTGKDRFALEVFFASNPSKGYSYALTPAGDGDEDYSEYNVASNHASTVNVQAAYIQESFNWADLIDTDGESFAHCVR